MVDHRAAFEEMIRENPNDPTIRAVFADWLEENGFDDEAQYQRSWPQERQKAEEWLREFAEECGETWTEDANGRRNGYRPLTLEDMIEAGRKGFVQEGSQEAQDVWSMASEDRRRKFWRCWHIVTGTPLRVDDDWDTEYPFSCAC